VSDGCQQTTSGYGENIIVLMKITGSDIILRSPLDVTATNDEL
jgi:hypothetical protein